MAPVLAAGAASERIMAPAEAATPAKGQIVFGHSADPDTLDPHTTIAGTAWVVLANIYDGLFMNDYSSTAIPVPTVPGLAQSFTLSPDRRTYTFVLRKNVKFHDGTLWDAEAAHFNFRRWFDKSFQYYYPRANATVKPFIGGIASYKAVDASTFEVVLEKPHLGWFDFLTKAPTFFMVSPEAVKKFGNEQFANHGGGTGPFIVEEYQRNVRLVLRRNQDYWHGSPSFERLVFVPVPDDAARVAGLISGEYGIAHEISPDSIPEIQARSNLEVELRGKPVTFGFGGNIKEKPWSDPRVRHAVSLAINRQAICTKLLRNAAIPATQFYGLGNEAFDPSLPIQDPYNPKMAKDLLTAAGYGQGLRATFHTSTSAMGVPEPARVLEQVQRDLQAVGIASDIVVTEWTDYLGLWFKGVPAPKEGNAPVYTMAMGWDTNQLLNAYADSKSQPPNGVNYVWYDNPEVDKLLDEAQQTTTLKAMIAKLREAQRLMLKDRPYVFVFHSKAPYGVSKQIQWVPASAWAQNLRLASVR
jgi:peptide/nickel transport system substrate-binding protein